MHNELLAAGVHLLDPEYLTLDAFEEFKQGPRAATLDRAVALSRDDLLYLRADHPMILSAQELLLSSETGNAAFLIDDALPQKYRERRMAEASIRARGPASTRWGSSSSRRASTVLRPRSRRSL